MADPLDYYGALKDNLGLGPMGSPTNTPLALGAPVPSSGIPNVGDTSRRQQGDLIGKLITMQRTGQLPQVLPPHHVQAGQLPYSDTPGPGSNKYNRKVTIAQSIGNLVADVENRHEDKKTRDIVYNVGRIQDIIQNPSDDPKIQKQNDDIIARILYKDGNPDHGLTKEGKDIQKALDINLGTLMNPAGSSGASKDDKTETYIKNARMELRKGYNIFKKSGEDIAKLVGLHKQQQGAPDDWRPELQVRPPLQQPQGQPQAQPPQQTPMPQQAPVPTAQPPQAPMGGQARVMSAPVGLGNNPFPAPAGGGAPIPAAQNAARPPATAAAPQQGRLSPADALRSMMPQTLGISPFGKAMAQGVEAKIIPDANHITQADWENFRDVTRLAIARGLMTQRESEENGRMLRSKDATERALGVARINGAARVIASQNSLKAATDRTSMVYQLTSNAQAIKVNLDSLDKQVNTQVDLIKAQREIERTTKSPMIRAEAKRDADNMEEQLKGLQQTRETLRNSYNSMGQMIIEAQRPMGPHDAGTSPEGGTTPGAENPSESPEEEQRRLEDLLYGQHGTSNPQ